MTPRMSADEVLLLKTFLSCADSYVEFGCGGSTVIASQLVKSSIISVDSSMEWLDQVAESCKQPLTRPNLMFVDIGKTGDWGVPMEIEARSRWPSYHQNVWKEPAAQHADLYMIDGRFRVACFLQILHNCRPDSVILFHDFVSRPHYHVVKEVAREIASVDDLSVFVPINSVHRVTLQLMLDIYRFDPA